MSVIFRQERWETGIPLQLMGTTRIWHEAACDKCGEHLEVQHQFLAPVLLRLLAARWALIARPIVSFNTLDPANTIMDCLCPSCKGLLIKAEPKVHVIRWDDGESLEHLVPVYPPVSLAALVVIRAEQLLNGGAK